MMVAAGRRKRVFLAGCENARALDAEAASWGLNEFSLVEAAGRLCAERCVAALPDIFAGGARELPGVLALAGSGNNAADALVMLRTLVVSGYADPACALALITKLPPEDEVSPLANAVKSLQSMDIPVVVWDARDADLLGGPDLIIDGITGTGLKGPLAGKALEMVEAATRLREMGVQTPVAAIDVPSGIFDGWKPGMPVLEADITLAVEPRKLCLYNLAARPYAGRIVPVENIFPQVLIERYGEAELLDWEKCAARILKIKSSAYKYERGLVEIHAGCEGAAGAACLAARGAQAAGAGLTRLFVDPPLYPALASCSGGIMVIPENSPEREAADGGVLPERFRPDAVLLGPGWGRGADRMRLLEKFLVLEENGVPLILDADAIALARDMVFHEAAVITPHAGEFSGYTGISVDDILADPVSVLRRFAKEKNVHILLKGHVLYIVAPDGRVGIIDGMNPALASGGSGDVLAGFCAAIAGRMYVGSRRQNSGAKVDLFECAAAAAALLMEAGRAETVSGRFADPLEIADAAAKIAGGAWLPAGGEIE